MNSHPEHLTELEAVKLAYEQDISRAAALLDEGLSVLVHVTQDVAPYLTTAIAAQCARPTRLVDIDGTIADQLTELARALAEAGPGQAVIVPNLDVLVGDAHGTMTDEARRATMLLRRTGPRALLAFLDPWLYMPDILQAQFQAHLIVDPPPPLLTTPAGPVPLGRALVTRSEAAMFSDFDEGQIYARVEGLSVVRIRRLLAALAAADAAPARRLLAEFGREASGLRLPTAGTSRGPAAALEAPATRLADFQGYADVKTEIAETLTLVRNAPGPFVPLGFLIYGASGNGKTTLAKAVAGELSATAVMLRCREVLAVAEPSARLIRQVFAQARRLPRSVLVLDDLDALDDEAIQAVIGEVAAAADQPGERAPSLVIGTATWPDRVGELRTRAGLLRPVSLPLPDLATRLELIAVFAARYDLYLGPELRDAVALASDGFSCGNLRAVFLATHGSRLAGNNGEVAEQLGVQVGTVRRALQEGLAASPTAERTSLIERPGVTLAVPRVDRSGLAKQAPGARSDFAKHAPDERVRSDDH